MWLLGRTNRPDSGVLGPLTFAQPSPASTAGPCTVAWRGVGLWGDSCQHRASGGRVEPHWGCVCRCPHFKGPPSVTLSSTQFDGVGRSRVWDLFCCSTPSPKTQSGGSLPANQLPTGAGGEGRDNLGLPHWSVDAPSPCSVSWDWLLPRNLVQA